MAKKYRVELSGEERKVLQDLLAADKAAKHKKHKARMRNILDQATEIVL